MTQPLALADPARVIAIAKSWLGTPYHDQASLRGIGYDCLGLARGVWREVVGPEPFPIPPYSRDWGETGPREVLAEGARRMMIEVSAAESCPGALVLFRMKPRAIAKHVGILTGPGTFLQPRRQAHPRNGGGWRRRFGSRGHRQSPGRDVVGVVSRVEQSDYVRGLGADEIALSPRDAPPDLKAASIDGILDMVGAPVFEMSLRALKPGGVLSLVGAVGGSDVRFDLWDLIRPVTLTGYSSESLDGPALRGAVAALTGWIKDGRIAAPRYTTVPLAEAAQAHAMLESRGVSGRVLLIP